MSKDDCIRLRKLREQVEQARNFPENTCPASRHLYMMADYLSKGEPYQMLADEPLHCAETMLAVLGSLWKARTELAKLNAVAQAPNAQQAEPPAWNALVSDREYLRLFDEARHGSTGGFGVLRGIRACIAAYEAATPAQQAEAQEPCAPAQLEAGAKKLAEVLDYPWEHMPQQGRQTMRDNVIAVLMAIDSAKNGAVLK